MPAYRGRQVRLGDLDDFPLLAAGPESDRAGVYASCQQRFVLVPGEEGHVWPDLLLLGLVPGTQGEGP